MIGAINTITDYMKSINVRDAMACGFIIIYSASAGYFYFKGQRDLKKYNQEKAKGEVEKKEHHTNRDTIDNYVN